MQHYRISQRFIFLIVFLLGITLGGPFVFAQTSKVQTDERAKERQRVLDSTRNAQKILLDASRAAQKRIADSTRVAQQAITEANRIAQKARIDSMRAAQQHALDSSKESRAIILDSVKAIRKQRTDSLTRIRKYKESRRYTDSVTKARNKKINTMRAFNKAKTDSMTAARKRITDSTFAIRKHSIDSVRAIQKHRSDSLAVIRKYRESKRFKDSVIVVRRVRSDSLRAVRKIYSDSMLAARKHVTDSAKAARKVIMDSTTAARKVVSDSLAVIRKKRAEEIAKKKAEREKVAKAKAKQSEMNLNLKMEVKIKSKRKAYSNEKMLKKKWMLPRQVIQNTFTHYNYYFNARRKMDEAELNMQRVGKDNYANRIDLFTFDPDRDSTVLASDMDSVIKKASLGIQIHDPRTKWGDDLYLLMGQAYYYKGNYDEANASFRYIVAQRQKERLKQQQKDAYKNKTVRGKRESGSVVDADEKKLLDFLKHESSNNEALLWTTRTMTQSGKYNESEAILDLLSHDAKFPEALRGRLALEQAYLDLKQKNNRSAAAQLVTVSADKNQQFWIRRRAAFLAGQILQDEGKYLESAAEFDKVVDLQPKIEMDFYARRNKAYSLMLAGGDQTEAIASLKRMLNDGKYAAYNEQIYFILGRLSLNSNNPKDAENYLQKSLASAKSTKKQKASSFALLGNIYYKEGRWDGAKSAYDSAAYFSSYAMDDKDVIVAKQRSRVLDQVSIPEKIIRTQDSLLGLAAMTDKEQRAVARRYIRYLQERRDDSIFRAENAVANPSQVAEETGNTPGAMNWYFSNPQTVQQGFNEFKRKWGTRPLVDNWQRSAVIGGARGNVAGSAGAGGSDIEDGAESAGSGLPTEEVLLASVPKTKQGQDLATRAIQRAYIDLGTAYVKALEDYPRAGKTLDTLDKRYATNPFIDEEIYVRYLLALRQGNLPQAQQYGKQLQDNYPASKWAEMVKPAADAPGEAGQPGVAAYYDETYNLLQQRQYTEVVGRAKTGRTRYNDDTYGKRFRIIESMAQAGSGNYVQADTMLTEFLRTNQADSLRVWAENVLKFVKEQRIADSLAHPKPIVDTAKSPAAVGVGGNTAVGSGTTPLIPQPAIDTTRNRPQIPAPANFTFAANEAHYFIFQFNAMGPRVMGVKSGLVDFNTLKFTGQNLSSDLEMMDGPQGVVVVKGFANSGQAKIYMNEFKRTPTLTREFAATDYQVYIISASNYLKLMNDKNINAYGVFYRSKY